MTIKRIHREIADLKKEDLGPIVLGPSDDNLYLWKGSIPGPEGSVYEGGVYNFEVNIPPDYPYVVGSLTVARIVIGIDTTLGTSVSPHLV